MSATLVDDLVGWGLFAVILANFAPQSTGQGQGMAIFGLVFLFCSYASRRPWPPARRSA